MAVVIDADENEERARRIEAYVEEGEPPSRPRRRGGPTQTRRYIDEPPRVPAKVTTLADMIARQRARREG